MPRFDIIQSNRLELLAGRLCDDLAKSPLASPLAKELIVVQEASVGKWLELAIARTSGIAANLRFLNPAQFAADLYRPLEPSLRSGSLFDPEVMQWRIFAILGDPKFVGRHPELAAFLKSGDAGRSFDLAVKIAEVFGRYLVYRMDWLAGWASGTQGSRGKDESWQSSLWRTLTGSTREPHHGLLFARLIEALETGRASLPERISVFGISSLSPAYAGILRAAGRHAAVNVYAMNPCRQEWGEIASDRQMGDLPYTPELFHLEVPHALLGSLGKQGRDFMGIVYERAGEGSGTIDLFVQPPVDSLLHALQAGILDLTEARYSAGPDDQSLQIHRCHTPMREVQVLRDRLLDLFDRDHSLKPSDVVVLAPDINEYAPYVDAVFATYPEESTAIPYEIADRTPAQKDPVVEAWLTLLDLPRSRFEADTVTGLLRLSPIASAFRISPEEIERLSEWVELSGIRWGIDGTQKELLGLPGDAAFTWSWGLDRLALGVALPRSAEGGPVFRGLLPFDQVEGQEIELLDRFVGFAQTLKEWTEDLSKPKTMGEWGDSLGAWLDRFFPGGRETAEQREEIRASIEQVLAGSSRAAYGKPVEYSVIRKLMIGTLGDNRSGLRFTSGGMLFSSMRPMRALPFRVICLLGLSDGVFPREYHGPGFDLMRRYYRQGDRSARLDDRYLFLELLLSARDRLIVSYVGEDVRSGKNLPPSPVLGELLDFAGRIAYAEPVDASDKRTPRERAEDALLIRHPLQSFSSKYFEVKDAGGVEVDHAGRKLFSYSDEDRKASLAIRSGTVEEPVLFPEPLPPFPEASKRVRLGDLCEFYKNPTKFLFNRRLNVYYRDEDDMLEGSEPLVVGKAEIRSIQRGLIASAGKAEVNAEDLAKVFGQLCADAKLPVGLPGRTGFSLQVKELTPVLAAYRALLEKERIPGVVKAVSLGEWELEIELDSGLTIDGCFQVKPGKLYGKDILPFWVRSLAMSLVHPNAGTGTLAAWLLGIGEEERQENKKKRKFVVPDLLTFRQDENAREVLLDLLRWYDVGLSRPISFFPGSSWAYAEGSRDDGDADAGIKKAKAEWIPESEDHGYPEANDAYYSRVFSPDETALNEEFVQLAKLFAVRAFQAMSLPSKAPKPGKRKR